MRGVRREKRVRGGGGRDCSCNVFDGWNASTVYCSFCCMSTKCAPNLPVLPMYPKGHPRCNLTLDLDSG